MESSSGNDFGGLAMLTVEEIARLLRPYINAIGEESSMPSVDWGTVYRRLAVYLELILKWNARMNLTAVREPEEIVRRHFGESLFAAGYVGRGTTLLDFGSGAGFPGVPIQIMRPDLRVTLAESQGKKVAFLREVVRELGLEAEVWGKRVEELPGERMFDVVAMRAVDKMEAAAREGAARAGVRLLVLGTSGTLSGLTLESFEKVESVGIPESRDGFLFVAERRESSVPRGTC